MAAKNYWGWGAFSEALAISATSFPEQVTTPATGIDEATGGLRVEWTAPFDNSAPITEYLIEAQAKDLSWISICDGTAPLVLQTQRCIESMATFTDESTFDLELQHVVIVRVSARNANGWSVPSNPNSSGAYLRTPPTYMNAPRRSANTNDLQLHVVWDALPNDDILITGGSAIISYGLEWDAGTAQATWT